MGENKHSDEDLGCFLVKNYYDIVSEICKDKGMEVNELLPKNFDSFSSNAHEEIKIMRFNNFERRRKEKIEIVNQAIKKYFTGFESKKNYETEQSLKRLKIHHKQPVFERVKKARKREIIEFVGFMKNSVEKITHKMNKSAENLKKVYENREKQIKTQSEIRNRRISQALQLKNQETKSFQRFLTIKQPSPKPKLLKSISLSKNNFEETCRTSQSLEKIEKRLKKSSDRAQLFRKFVSLSAAKLSSPCKPLNPMLSERHYREKLEKIFNSQKKITKNKDHLLKKLALKAQKANQKKAEKSENF